MHSPEIEINAELRHAILVCIDLYLNRKNYPSCAHNYILNIRPHTLSTLTAPYYRSRYHHPLFFDLQSFKETTHNTPASWIPTGREGRTRGQNRALHRVVLQSVYTCKSPTTIKRFAYDDMSSGIVQNFTATQFHRVHMYWMFNFEYRHWSTLLLLDDIGCMRSNLEFQRKIYLRMGPQWRVRI